MTTTDSTFNAGGETFATEGPVESLISSIVSYILGVVGNLHADSIARKRRALLLDHVDSLDKRKDALSSLKPLRDDVLVACTGLARHRFTAGVSPSEMPLWELLPKEEFQTLLFNWLRAGGIEEGSEAKERLVSLMKATLERDDQPSPEADRLTVTYLEAVEKTIFATPLLARWRHQLSLDYLREQVAAIRLSAEEMAGRYSPERQKAVLEMYYAKALKEWDIIDLSNLPESDVHIATQALLLRKLYVPLRILVDSKAGTDGSEEQLKSIEADRDARRKLEAGRASVARDSNDRVPIGARLSSAKRMVVLGDPGGGKSTMLRWMATAFLLRLKGEEGLYKLPDVQSLPSNAWIPVLIRCRDIGEADLCRSFVDFLTQHLNKSELLPDEATVMRAVVLDRVARGEVILLIDGLDEITNPRARVLFCEELERVAVKYPDAAVIVTSRIVGYRDMPHRMGSGFEHSQIAELSSDDKDLFARSWVEITEQHQTQHERDRRAQELRDALHSSDRVERLTGNPMLLTTLALVKRKVGKLPNRRNKLYAEAVSVLLNWNPRLYETIDEDEAIPQLEYLAYEMCRKGVQRLLDDDVLELLDALRKEYPNIRALNRRDPASFLKALEARSSILIRSGGDWRKGKASDQAVWEFRHLTFQEYLTARALIDGRFPGRDKSETLAGLVARLAGTVKKQNDLAVFRGDKFEISESWREALRLLVADCNDDLVDAVLLAIAQPRESENALVTGRPRAALAAQCLADEPNVSEQTAAAVIDLFARGVGSDDGLGRKESILDRAATDLASSIWCDRLKSRLIELVVASPPEDRWHPGGLLGVMEEHTCKMRNGIDFVDHTRVIGDIQSHERARTLSACFFVMQAAFTRDLVDPGDDLGNAVLSVLASDEKAVRFAAAWAIGWLMRGSKRDFAVPPLWKASAHHLESLVLAYSRESVEEVGTRRWLIVALGSAGDPIGFPVVHEASSDSNFEIRQAAAHALGNFDLPEARELLIDLVAADDAELRSVAVDSLVTEMSIHELRQLTTHANADVRRAGVRGVALQAKDKLKRRLLSVDLDGRAPYIDPAALIGSTRVAEAASRTGKTHEEVEIAYAELATEIYLNFGKSS